ncbi:uncharacterized protein PAN0_007d3177 [Moesziomyces antarcticus]|uniref:Uncharacterized protein n=2 Tax=Pseudozyma antarctica TaxID=84753 RepID=A0A5C3FNV7_PSEA2|nr:uncharacterized protein PAN0_007d3177 [Moesziomyces antarcticus]GAK64961.1 conserved hypothetical protein [Moesziomyces antarcticus]SPO46052.1 uncharacterized protein PSANT_03738 [Moesziomyces antarcticus]
MSDVASASDASYRHRLSLALHASRILTGALDDELGIQKGTKTTKLGARHREEYQAVLHATLAERVRSAIVAWTELEAFPLHPDPETATGDLALHLLSHIHACLVEKKRDAASRVAVEDDQRRGIKSKGVQPKEDVGLGVKDVKLVTTLQSLVSRWALSSRIKAYDRALFSLSPNSKAQIKAPPLSSQNRFEEIDDEHDASKRHAAVLGFETARTDLAIEIDALIAILNDVATPHSTGGPSSALTDVVTVVLRVGIVDYLSSLLRLGFGPLPPTLPDATPQPRSASVKDAIQKRAAAATNQLLRFLSTHSAMSALSSVISHSDAKLGVPSFVKAISSRLLSAQLLRPDGVRSLLIITFGTGDLTEAAELNAADAQSTTPHTGTQEPGSNSLKRFEQCARLLLTPPHGMPVDVYMPIILPNLLDVLAPHPNASVNLTPPPQEQMRAAGFVLTRISERHPALFASALQDRIYTHFSPALPGTAAASASGGTADAQAESVVVTSSAELERAVATLSSFLLFSEPSPTFFTTLFDPVLPQLLTLYHFLCTPTSGAGKGKVRSVESGGHRDNFKVEVGNFLKTWLRLVDAQHGAGALVRAIQAAEVGIGSQSPDALQGRSSEDASLFWSEETDGIAIRYGRAPESGEHDLSAMWKDLSLAALAKQISAGSNDEVDLSKIAPDLATKLGLHLDPCVMARLLKTAERKDLARLTLPLILNIYMAQKAAARARIATAAGPHSETRSVLYLQIILQLFDAFGADLLQGDTQATLAFIDFALSSPSQRSMTGQSTAGSANTAETKAAAEESMPFISAKPQQAQSGVASLFNVAAEASARESSAAQEDKTQMAEDEDEADEDEEELVTTALSLLLSLLEANTAVSTETQPMLVVILDKIDALLDSGSDEVRALAKEAKLVLLARRNSVRGSGPSLGPSQAKPTSETSAKALEYVQAQETYQEALRLLQDPILPVRAHGLVLLRRLVSDDAKQGGQAVARVDPALVPAILDIFLHAVQDEESYLYLNAVQGLSALASSGGGQTIARLVGIYIGRDDGLASQRLPAREVEKRLRVGEALLQVVQRCADALPAHVDAVVPPLLAKLSDRALPNVLRSSFISILGTVVEAAPLSMATKGYAAQMAQICIDIVVFELVHRPAPSQRGSVKLNVQGRKVSDVDDDEQAERREVEQRKLDSATVVDAKVAHLRRAAMLLLTLLVRGTSIQLETANEADGPAQLVERLSALRLPGGGSLPSVDRGEPQPGSAHKARLGARDLLFPVGLATRLREVAAYAAANDTDMVVRTHAHDCVQLVDALQLDLVHADLVRNR